MGPITPPSKEGTVQVPDVTFNEVAKEVTRDTLQQEQSYTDQESDKYAT